MKNLLNPISGRSTPHQKVNKPSLRPAEEPSTHRWGKINGAAPSYGARDSGGGVVVPGVTEWICITEDHKQTQQNKTFSLTADAVYGLFGTQIQTH